MKLSLYIPASPYVITQGFGIYNPAYEQFGFNKHNGIDFAVDKDGKVKAMCDGVVTEVGTNNGAGKFVRYMTNELVEVEGRTAYAGFMYMHASKQLVVVGQKIKAGDDLIIAGNTGFSTGPHTHISAYLCNENGSKQARGSKDSDYCFDFSKYFNGINADDISEQVDPALEQTIVNGLETARLAIKYPWMIAPALKLLQMLSNLLKK